MRHKKAILSLAGVVALVLLALAVCTPVAQAQETTAGIQGYVKDPSGAAIPGARVEISSEALIGGKKGQTDSSGYYRFYYLPPGEYTLTVTAANFRTYKQTGIKLEVGRLPTIDVELQIGQVTQVVEVSGQAPIVDVTTSKAAVTVTPEILHGIPTGRSFQSLIPFAPGSRQEPLQSNDRARGGGFQIDGASDGDNQYLVEGLDTTEIRNGGTGTNVPIEFLQEVQIKSSGFEAEFGGGAGVVNVVQKRGSNAWHGSVFTKYVTDAANANDQCNITAGSVNPAGSLQCGARDNPSAPNPPAISRGDRPLEYYQQKKDHRRILEPGFEVGGPLLTDRLWAFVSYLPTIDRVGRTATFTGLNPGPRRFTRVEDTHNGLARLDYRMFESLRLWGSWQYGYRRLSGVNLPGYGDSLIGQTNPVASTDPATLRPDTGSVNPLNIFTFGGTWTPTSKIVAGARFGQFYYNTEDRGRPTGIRYFFNQTLCSTVVTAACPAGSATLGTNGLPITTNGALANPAGFSNLPSIRQQQFEVLQRKQLQTDFAFYAGNFLGGTHNFKVGYGFNRLSDNVLVSNNKALVVIDWAVAASPGSAEGIANCAPLIAANGSCQGTAGFFTIQDGVNVKGNVGSYNHSIYVQDAWTIKRLTINAGVRFDKEFVPPFSAGANQISFGFSQKVAPRIGAAYDLLGKGKVKIYGSYGKFFDIMKYSLPRGSFGGEYWHNCVYALNGAAFDTILPTAPGSLACPPSGPAPGVTPNTGIVGAFIENLDLRKNLLNPTLPGLDPNIKPQQQHEWVLGTDWAITPSLGLEVRYARKRLDWAIEDMALTDDLGFYIGNPGTDFGDLVRRITPPDTGVVGDPGHPAECATCPRGPKAIRRYDGLEFRLTKRASSRWFGSVSYTYSKLEGNYSGLSATTITDGGFGGRHNPNNDRSFDLPNMSFTAHGQFMDGPLPTDRPHTLKLFGWYALKWFHQETTIGLSQLAFSGTPRETCWNAIDSVDGCSFVENRGNFVKLHVDVDPTTGVGRFVSDGIIKGQRTPAFTQTDMNLSHEFKVSKKNENLRMGFEWTVLNIFNQRAPIQYWTGPIDGRFNGVFPATVCGGGTTPDPFVANAFNTPSCIDWKAFFTGWDYIATTNATPGLRLDNRYGQPVIFQGARAMRFKIKFMF
ncbi:MAG: TonB-dependent receptor [Acidobacteria bacterium]|nr:TonB-dependent receptor [Acidobacteriota bacterium]